MSHELLKLVLSLEEEADLILQAAHDQASHVYSEARAKAQALTQSLEKGAEDQAERIRAEEHSLAEQELTAARERETDGLKRLTAAGRERLPEAVAEILGFLKEKA